MQCGTFVSTVDTEPRQYNTLQQLTRLTVPGVMDHEYRFSATQNDGRLTQRKDWVSGEEITYQYDTLNRLISAQTTGPEWGQSFGYDGFGNLLSQTVTKGSAPSMSVTVDPATNRITNGGTSYDVKGNLTAMAGLTMTYDPDNRMISNSSGDAYLYDAGGQRAKKTNGGITALYFYGVEGNLLNNWPNGYNVYFGKKPIYNSGGTVVRDRLGSVVNKDWTTTSYFPYGDEPTTTTQNRPKFATYFRDGTTALDYAQQRYYASTLGRFTSPDPYVASGGPADPQSWNRYAYVQNDPVNYNDPTGLFMSFYTDDSGPAEGRIDWAGPHSGTVLTPERAISKLVFPDPPQVTYNPSPGATGVPPAPVPGSIGRAGDAVAELLDAFSVLPDCAKIFGGASAVTSFAKGMVFLDGRLPGTMAAAGGPTNMSFEQYHSQHLSTFASTLAGADGRLSKTVVLWADFFGAVNGQPPARIDQQVVLVHEFLHSYFQLSADDHSDFMSRFGIRRGPLDYDNTEAIDRWIKQDCPKPQVRRTR